MPVRVQFEDFDVARELDALRAGNRAIGAVAAFVGTVRDINDDAEIATMTLEHYPGMTEKHLQTICKEAGNKWELIDVIVIHRVGEIIIGDPIVLVGVWSAHRAVAFDACRFIMEDLKSRAPFWKQETLENGKRWVEKNTPG